MQLGEQVVRNGDYYSFLVHLAQKKEYKVTQIIAKPDTFLEEAVKVFLEERCCLFLFLASYICLSSMLLVVRDLLLCVQSAWLLSW